MANRIDFTALKTYIETNYIKDVENYITPTRHNSAISDILDTVLTRSATVANMTALNALVYGTDFGENDIRIVLTDSDGEKGVYAYIYNEDTPGLEWVKIGGVTSNINRTSVATIALMNALTVNEDFNAGDTITVLDNGYGEKIKYRYMYDEATTSNKWVEIGVLSQFN